MFVEGKSGAWLGKLPLLRRQKLCLEVFWRCRKDPCCASRGLQPKKTSLGPKTGSRSARCAGLNRAERVSIATPPSLVGRALKMVHTKASGPSRLQPGAPRFTEVRCLSPHPKMASSCHWTTGKELGLKHVHHVHLCTMPLLHKKEQSLSKSTNTKSGLPPRPQFARDITWRIIPNNWVITSLAHGPTLTEAWRPNALRLDRRVQGLVAQSGDLRHGDPILGWTNIHLPPVLMFTRFCRVLTHSHVGGPEVKNPNSVPPLWATF